MFGTTDDNIRLDTQSLKFFYTCLRRFCLKLTGSLNIEMCIRDRVNDLIKMAERRGATYYGSWIEDERQYVAGAHFCVCLNKPVELPERDGSYVKNQMYDYMENARIMNEK